jgi:hypothetical protein
MHTPSSVACIAKPAPRSTGIIVRRRHKIAERRFAMPAYLIAFVDIHDRAR